MNLFYTKLKNCHIVVYVTWIINVCFQVDDIGICLNLWTSVYFWVTAIYS